MQAIISATSELKGFLHPPSSKNYTTRYLLVTSLAEGQSVIIDPAASDDATAMMECCQALGATLTWEDNRLLVTGFGRNPVNPRVINPHNAGTVLRLLLGTASLLDHVTFETDYPESLGTRPNDDLLKSLAMLGVECESRPGGRLPITLNGSKLHGGLVEVSGEVSSQYVSSLLFLAPLIGEDVEIKVINGLKSKPLIRTTLNVMAEAGISVEHSDDLMNFSISDGQFYQPRTYEVHGDYPGTSALLAAAAVTKSEVTIDRLYDDEQGEKRAIDVLRAMGCDIKRTDNTITVNGTGKLHGTEFNGDQATDAVLALVGAACLAEGTTRFYDVENLRYKECDRITEPLAELKKIGVKARETQSEIIIEGNPNGYEGGIEVDAHNDHRVIMMLTIVGLRCQKGLKINNAHHIAKSYPRFFEDIKKLGGNIELKE